MAEHPNAALVRTGYEAFARGDMATLSELFASDVLWHEAGKGFALAGDYKGQEAVFTMFARLLELTQGNFAIRLEDCIADDRQAVAVHTVTARRGLRTYTAREAVVFHLLDGKVTDAWHTVPDVEAFDAFWLADDQHPNVDLVRRGYEAFSVGDMATMTELIADNVVWHAHGGSPFDGDYLGREAVFAMFARLMQETGGTFRIDIDDILCNDDRATVVGKVTASRNGRTETTGQVMVHRIRDGRTVEFWAATMDAPASVSFWEG